MTDAHKNATPPSTGPHRVKLETWISCAPFERLLNMEIIEAKDAHATLKMPFFYELAQGAGLMHGGALVSLADTAVVMAIKSVVPPRTHFATVSMESKFLYPVKQGMVTARAVAEIEGNRTINGSAMVYDQSDKPVLEFYSRFKIAKNPKINEHR